MEGIEGPYNGCPIKYSEDTANIIAALKIPVECEEDTCPRDHSAVPIKLKPVLQAATGPNDLKNLELTNADMVKDMAAYDVNARPTC